ncbi:MAG: hypothetical protein JWM44_1331 [Bacilli bacterium]|nr:hypothetical protein [Bacilli bacterium]
MAKTVLEKLQAAIETAATLREGAVVGDQEGQYSQENVNSLSSSIELAHGSATNENAEQPQLESALEAIGAAIKMFKGSIMKDPDKPANNPVAISLKGVVLNGTDSEKKGTHTIFAYGGAVAFNDGKANVNEDLAKKLISDGYAEEGKPEAGE